MVNAGYPQARGMDLSFKESFPGAFGGHQKGNFEMKTKAAILVEQKKPLVIDEVEIPALGLWAGFG